MTRELNWEGARVVEWDGLENRCGLRSTEGSNPSLPASEKRVHADALIVSPEYPLICQGRLF